MGIYQRIQNLDGAKVHFFIIIIIIIVYFLD
jgi:hypothetical protein